MSKKLFALTLALLMLFSIPAALAEDTSVTVTDMLDREITLAEPATRVVALSAADCEIVCALGCEEALVGRGKYCNYPESILELPALQSGKDTNIEEILALEPQIVIMSDMAQTEEQVKLEASRCLSCGATTVDQNKCIGCGICTTRCKFDAIHLRRIRPEFANYINGDYSKQAIIKHGIKRAARLTIKRIQGKV